MVSVPLRILLYYLQFIRTPLWTVHAVARDQQVIQPLRRDTGVGRGAYRGKRSSRDLSRLNNIRQAIQVCSKDFLKNVVEVNHVLEFFMKNSYLT